ncbi:MAG: sigma-54 dependent transcriptional regulator [Planctomycetota bacterium]
MIESSNQSVLVVDDEPAICWAFEKMLRGEGHQVHTASSAEDGLVIAAKQSLDLVVLDVRLPGRDGISSLSDFQSVTDHAPVIIVTAFGDLDTAVSAVKQGASDYLTKPFKLDDALRACRQVLRSRADARRREKPWVLSKPNNEDSSGDLIGRSPAMQKVFRQIALVAASNLSVLITGETGTGKELVAAAIARHSDRSSAPYLPVAPVALNPELIESELFGHVQGAFTGADADRAGLFERAEGGTILFDEIGDLPLGTQVKLLRVLEQGQYSRVGDTTPRTADVRLIAATNCDLHEAVAKGEFREDLFHRISGMPIHLPALRDRAEDISPLCRHFLVRMGHPDPDAAIGDPLLEQLKQRPWNGNVRELRNAVEHAAVLARGRPFCLDDFPQPHPGRDLENPSDTSGLGAEIHAWCKMQLPKLAELKGTLHAKFLCEVEPALFRAVLDHTGGNRAKAAEMLGMHRSTLRDRLRTYDIDPG